MAKKIERFRDKYWFLSNFSEYPVYYQGRIWPTAEHAYQAMKTLIIRRQEEIRLAKTPGEAKKMGRHKKTLLRPGWDDRKNHFMMEIVTAKFNQNPEIREKLLETMDAELAEGNNWGDTYWGEVDGKGENHLGKILMEVRRRILERMKPLRCPECGHMFSVSDIYEGDY